jgi:hypothetical protein
VFDALPWFTFPDVVGVVDFAAADGMVFLDPILLPCANTSELVAVAKSVTPTTNITPYISTFLLTIFEFFVLLLIARVFDSNIVIMIAYLWYLTWLTVAYSLFGRCSFIMATIGITNKVLYIACKVYAFVPCLSHTNQGMPVKFLVPPWQKIYSRLSLLLSYEYIYLSIYLSWSYYSDDFARDYINLFFKDILLIDWRSAAISKPFLIILYLPSSISAINPSLSKLPSIGYINPGEGRHFPWLCSMALSIISLPVIGCSVSKLICNVEKNLLGVELPTFDANNITYLLYITSNITRAGVYM